MQPSIHTACSSREGTTLLQVDQHRQPDPLLALGALGFGDSQDFCGGDTVKGTSLAWGGGGAWPPQTAVASDHHLVQQLHVLGVELCACAPVLGDAGLTTLLAGVCWGRGRGR